MKKRTLLSWSSGKDSGWTLHVLNRMPEIEVTGLFCTYNEKYERGAMHAVRIELIRQQADGAGLPLQLIPIPHPCSDVEYSAIMARFIDRIKAEGTDAVAFGDLYLEDVRSYREANLAGTGIEPLFPLWEIPTRRLAAEMVDAGLRAKITCIDPKHLPADFAGREYDRAFLAEIPPSIDPCGENGEFHSFVYDGPMFSNRVDFSTGETVSRDGYVFTDLLSAAQ
jgi:uncharacterized protein (TIGR00290 family)